MTAVAWDRRWSSASLRALTPAPPPSAIVAGGSTTSVGAALALAFDARIVSPSVAGVPPGAAVCIAVGPHDGRHRPREWIGDFGGPVVLVGGRCAPDWSPSSGSLVVVPATSSTGERLLSHAARWASVFGVPMWLTTVVERIMSAGATTDDFARTDLLASGLLNRMSRQLSLMGVDAGWDVLYGRSVLHALRAYARDLPAGLIAMEAPRPLTRRGNLWTVAHSVARASDVPVLLLPTSTAAPRAHPPAPPPARRPTPRPAASRVMRVREEPPPPPAPARRTPRIATGFIVLAVLVAVLGALGQMRVPYDSVHPGDSPRLAGIIRINGAPTFATTGSVRLLTVNAHRCTLFDAVRGWIDPDVDVVPDHVRQVEAARLWEANRRAMADAKSTARVVALQRLGYSLDIDVVFDTARVVGPSGGLAFTLALLDSLTPGQLIGDVDVAVTGTIDLAGSVGSVGGLRQKIAAAEASGVDLVLVPAVQRDDAVAYAHDRVAVVGVGSLADALDALRRHGGDPLPPAIARERA